MADILGKVFNPEVFEAYVRQVPNTNRNELLKSGVFVMRNDLKNRLSAQVGGNYIVEPFKGRIGGEALNYDGATDITLNSRDTYKQGKIVIGRAKGWSEEDFATDITGGVDFLATAADVAQYWQDVDQSTLLSILKGVFAMTDGSSADFVTKHTYDISGEVTNNKVSQTSLNVAIQKACGDNKDAFAVAITHSQVATNLENLNLLENLKYTDESGIQRDLGLYTWNGKLLLVDDNMPAVSGDSGVVYTTYVLGKGAFEYCDCGAKVPFEYARDALTNGGVSEVISRQRKLFAPAGISFEPASIPTSPTNAQLEAATSWKLARNTTGVVIPHKLIPIAQIKSLG